MPQKTGRRWLTVGVPRARWLGVDQSWIDPGAAAGGEGGRDEALVSPVQRVMGPAYRKSHSARDPY